MELQELGAVHKIAELDRTLVVAPGNGGIRNELAERVGELVARSPVDELAAITTELVGAIGNRGVLAHGCKIRIRGWVLLTQDVAPATIDLFEVLIHANGVCLPAGAGRGDVEGRLVQIHDVHEGFAPPAGRRFARSVLEVAG